MKKKILILLAVILPLTIASAVKSYTRKARHVNIRPEGIGEMEIGSTFIVR